MMEGRNTTARERVREARDSRGVVARPLFVSVIFRCALCAFLVFVLICQPYTISARGWQITVQKQEAQALPAAVPVALEFLEALAAAAGMSVPDFMLTCGVGIAATTGYNIFSEQAKYAADGTVNGLHRLVSTAEWPAWDTLSDEVKTTWGSEENYTAAQFNSALDVFGLGENRDAFYNAGGGSGGGTIDEGSTTLASRIGEIGQIWATGGRTSILELQQLVAKSTGLFPDGGADSFGVRAQSTAEYNGKRVTFWVMEIGASNGTHTITSDNWTSYSYILRDDGSIFSAFIFDEGKTRETYNLSTTSSLDYWEATTRTLGNYRYNLVEDKFSSTGGTWVNCRNPDTNPENYAVLNYLKKDEYRFSNNPMTDFTELDYGQMSGTEGNPVEGMEYPADGVGASEIKPDTSWPSLFGEPSQPIIRPETPFNPDNQSGSDEFDHQALSVFIPLIQLPFDKMFPFCVIWDIGKLMDKMYELGGVGSVSADQSTSLRSVYAQRDGLQVQGDRGDVDLSIPGKPEWTQGHTEIVADLSQFGIPGTEGLTLSVDVWPLAVLLSYIRPFLQMLFIAGLLYVTILTFRMFIFNG